jgi:hypothetical protein
MVGSGADKEVRAAAWCGRAKDVRTPTTILAPSPVLPWSIRRRAPTVDSSGGGVGGRSGDDIELGTGRHLLASSSLSFGAWGGWWWRARGGGWWRRSVDTSLSSATARFGAPAAMSFISAGCIGVPRWHGGSAGAWRPWKAGAVVSPARRILAASTGAVEQGCIHRRSHSWRAGGWLLPPLQA